MLTYYSMYISFIDYRIPRQYCQAVIHDTTPGLDS